PENGRLGCLEQTVEQHVHLFQGVDAAAAVARNAQRVAHFAAQVVHGATELFTRQVHPHQVASVASNLQQDRRLPAAASAATADFLHQTSLQQLGDGFTNGGP